MYMIYGEGDCYVLVFRARVRYGRLIAVKQFQLRQFRSLTIANPTCMKNTSTADTMIQTTSRSEAMAEPA